MNLRRPLTLKGLFVALVVAGVTYVAAIGLIVATGVGPGAARLLGHTEVILAAHDAINGRVNELERMITDVHAFVRARVRGAPVDAIALSALSARARALADSSAATGIALRVGTVPVDMRLALGSAASAESAMAAAVVAALSALEVGRLEVATEWLVEADERQRTADKGLTDAQRLAILDVIRRERALQTAARTASRAVVWWLAIGSVLLGGALVLLRRRFYAPMLRLEQSLARVAEGDLETTVLVRRDDEIGRLGVLFNHMTGVLRERQAEERRRREDIAERFGRIIDESSGEVFMFDASTLALEHANRGAQAALGHTAAELAGRRPLDLWPTLDRRAFAETIRQLRAGSRDRARFSAMNTRSDGTTYPIEISLRYSATDEPAFVALVQDLTQRHQLEALRDRLARFAIERQSVLRGTDLQSIIAEVTELAAVTLDVVRVGVWRIHDGQFECLDVYERTAHRHSVLPALSVDDYPVYVDAMMQDRSIAVTDALSDPRTLELAADYFVPFGITSVLDAAIRVGGALAGVICHEHTGEPRVWTAEEQIIAGTLADLVAMALEATERRRAEEALRRSEERYRTAFENATVGVAEVAGDGRFMSVNREMSRILGYDRNELLSLRWHDVAHADGREDATESVRAMFTGELSVYRREMRYVRKNGSIVWCNASSGPVRSRDGGIDRLIVVLQDVTDEHALHEQLAHAQKMDSVGRLAGGIAHDFNNLLTAIIGYVELCRAAVDPTTEMAQDLSEIERAANRAADLTQHLLTFARRQIIDPQTADLNVLTRRTEKLLRRLIGEHVELVTRLESSLGFVQIDPGQFEQVLVNLAVNARDAMTEGGRLTITTRNGPRPGDGDGGHEGVIFEVADTGSGMTEEVRARIFEPFFTTKEAGHGTGLGLSICWGIIEQAGGRIDVASEPGTGTAVRVWLPRVIARDLDGEASHQLPPASPGLGERILVAEDEAQVRRLIERTLRQHGFDVAVAASGEEAHAIACDGNQRIDLVLTDLVMPAMGGRDLADRLHIDRPGLPVLFMSGYSERSMLPPEIIDGRSSLLSKPFAPEELIRRVRELLDTDSAATSQD